MFGQVWCGALTHGVPTIGSDCAAAGLCSPGISRALLYNTTGENIAHLWENGQVREQRGITHTENSICFRMVEFTALYNLIWLCERAKRFRWRACIAGEYVCSYLRLLWNWRQSWCSTRSRAEQREPIDNGWHFEGGECDICHKVCVCRRARWRLVTADGVSNRTEHFSRAQSNLEQNCDAHAFAPIYVAIADAVILFAMLARHI